MPIYTLQSSAAIMVVDDEPANVRLLERILQRVGYLNLISTSDPREVIRLYQQCNPDLLLLDLHMPYRSGFHLLHELRALLPQGDHVPILVLTADTTPGARQRALAEGAVDFITKPFDESEVLLRINNHLAIRRLNRELQQQNEILERRVQERTAELLSREQHVKKLAERLLMAYEDERRLIAYDLHDGVTQVATSAYHYLQSFQVRHVVEEEGRQDLERILEISHRVIEELRRVIGGLRPAILDDFGLEAALRREVEVRRAQGLEISYEQTLGTERLPPVVETALFWVAQEALTNIHKHAHAERARIALRRGAQSILLEIQDWGVGFMVDQQTRAVLPGEAIGLLSMRDRITLLGGSCTIQSESGAGTLIVAEVPCPSVAGA